VSDTPPIFTRVSMDSSKMGRTRRRYCLQDSVSIVGPSLRSRKMMMAELYSSSPQLTVSRRTLRYSKNRLSYHDKEATARFTFQFRMKPPEKSLVVEKLPKPSEISSIEEILDEVSYYEEEVLTDDDGDEFELIEEEIDDEIEPVVVPATTTTATTTIRFDSSDSFCATIHIHDYTSVEVENVWYNNSDYEKMVQMARAEIAIFEARKTDDRTRDAFGDEIEWSCVDVRGLEGWTSEGSKAIRELRERAIDSVWDEQSRQMEKGVKDIEKIREEYRKVSEGAQSVAVSRAAKDRIQADQILLHDDCANSSATTPEAPTTTSNRRNTKDKIVWGRSTGTRRLFPVQENKSTNVPDASQSSSEQQVHPMPSQEVVSSVLKLSSKFRHRVVRVMFSPWQSRT